MSQASSIDATAHAPAIHVIEDLEALRVIAHPLRLQLFERLRDRPSTVRELADALDAGPTRLYYHIKLLLDHGLIQVVETRVVSGIAEKRYAASAPRLSIKRTLLERSGSKPEGFDSSTNLDGLGLDGLEALLGVVIGEATAEIRRAVAEGRADPARTSPAEGGLLLGRVWMRMSPARAQAFIDRIAALQEEFDASPDEADATAYELLLGLYPIAGPTMSPVSVSPDSSDAADPIGHVSDGD